MSVLSVRALSKAFGGTHALSDVDLELESGTVHAVIGENGAGKSTLMKILAGSIAADAGTMTLAGLPYTPADPDAARKSGIAIVPQEPELAPHLSVEENVMLGAEPTRWGFVDRAELRRRAEAALSQVAEQGEVIEPGRSALGLSPSERQRVIIARALAVTELRVLILDEPTSSLTAADVERLFAVIRTLQERGISILYVSHFLEEISRICDNYSVLRDGAEVGSGQIATTNIDELVALMAGKTVTKRERRQPRETTGGVVLRVNELAGAPLPKSVTLELRKGEVLGIAGLVGAGRSELLRTIFGLSPVLDGQVSVGAYAGPASPIKRLTQGVGLLSEDRKGEGLAMDLSIRENLVMSQRCNYGPFVRPSQESDVAKRFAERLAIHCRDVEQHVRELSGGNQQKVALARLLHHDVDVLLLDEPTRGIDVNSRADVHRVIDELVQRGKSVLLVSSYMPELLDVCDRIAVMSRGTLGPARPVDELDERILLKEAAGA